jgi:copper oxidase (laccase) domain-containing protein
MTQVSVFISTAKDGSIYDRHEPTNPRIINNRERYLRDHEIPFLQTTRVNPDMLERATGECDIDYCQYIEVSEADKGKGMVDNDVFVADALITAQTDHPLMLPVADCVGAVFYDNKHHILMVSHLGRHSLEQEGGKKCVHYLTKHYHSDPAQLEVWLTPAPSKEAYPIWALDNKGMKEVTFEQLLGAGVLKENITDSPIDTDKDPNYFSYSEFLKGNRDEDGDYMIVAVMDD